MSRHHLRKDDICQNCGYTVDKRFCSSCGQENIESRQSFGHLVKHFFEDFTHYEGNFWRTIKYLLFRPAYLTKTYLSGKRVSFVIPVKLYIFVSFVAFFLPAVLPDYEEEHASSTAAAEHPETEHADTVKGTNTKSIRYTSVRQYDSIQLSLPVAKREKGLTRKFRRRSIELSESDDRMGEKLLESLSHNFPKALFVYMPLFAFVLWLFHSKRKWYYFDHAIFTLHFFSFILLVFTSAYLVDAIVPWGRWGISENLVSFLVYFPAILWAIFYFFRAHHRLYDESRLISRFKALVIFGINLTLFFIVLLGFVLFIFFTVH